MEKRALPKIQRCCTNSTIYCLPLDILLWFKWFELFGPLTVAGRVLLIGFVCPFLHLSVCLGVGVLLVLS